MTNYSDCIPKYMQGITQINKTTAQQYEWLYTHRCAHRHRFSRHFNCFLKQFGVEERIGFLDIETTNLKADFGFVLCWCILDDKGNLYEDWTTLEDIQSGYEDKRVIQTCIDTMTKFDRVVGHYSTYFDLPFLRTRALIHNIKFPEYGELYHTDVWRMARSKLCIHSNRQDCVAEALQGKTIKTRIDHPSWRKAAMGDKKAIAEVLKHCEHDVPDLKKNFYSLLPFYKLARSSI